MGAAHTDMTGTHASPGAETAARSRLAAAAIIGLCLAIVAVFAPLRGAQFLDYDDDVYVTANGLTSQGITWQGLRWAATNAEFNWHPLTWLSHMLDCQLFGLNPGAHHLSSVAWHALNSALLLYVLLRFTGALWPSTAVAALFALHPLHVEPVAWIAARKDLLSTGFWFAALLAYLRFTERRTADRYLLVCLCLLLSLMCKGMAVTLPFTLLVLDYWPLRRWPAGSPHRRAGDLLLEKLPLLLIALAGMGLQLIAQRWSGGLRSLDEVPLSLRIATAVVAYSAYLGKMLWPVDLALPYPLHAPLPPVGQIVGSALCLTGVTAAVAVWGRERRYVVAGWLWYLITLLPVSGLISIGSQSMADRYTYVPLIGLFVVIAWGAADLTRTHPTRRWALSFAAGVVLLLCVTLTRQQLRYWQDSLTLFRHTLAVTTDNPAAEINLGAALEAAGARAEARAHYATALRLSPTNASAHNNMGALLVGDGEFAGGELHLREALRLNPDLAVARTNLGGALLLQEKTAEALEQFRIAAARQPLRAKAHLGLAQALHGEGQLTEALAEYARTVELDPTFAAAHYSFAQALDAVGRSDEAIAHYREAVRLNPQDADAENNLGAALKAAGQRAEARAHFTASLRLNPANPEAQNNLGVLLFEDGQLSEAEAHLREALRLKPDYVWARINLGTARRQQGDLAGAREQFSAAVELDPRNATAHYDLAEALESEGRLSEAMAEYEHVLRLEPNVPEAQMRLARLREAQRRPVR